MTDLCMNIQGGKHLCHSSLMTSYARTTTELYITRFTYTCAWIIQNLLQFLKKWMAYGIYCGTALFSVLLFVWVWFWRHIILSLQKYTCITTVLLTHWGRVTHICVSKLAIIGSDKDLSPGRGQAIIWTNAGILLIGPFGTNFSEILIEIHIFSLKKMYLKMSSEKWWPICIGLNVLNILLSASGHGTYRTCYCHTSVMFMVRISSCDTRQCSVNHFKGKWSAKNVKIIHQLSFIHS